MGIPLREESEVAEWDLRDVKRRDSEEMTRARIATGLKVVHSNDSYTNKQSLRRFNFGKYAGSLLVDVINFDYDYAVWFAGGDAKDVEAGREPTLQMLFLRTLLSHRPPPLSLPSYHVGKVGERISRTVEVAMKKVVNGFYGESLLLKFKDEEGNVLMTFYSGNSSDIWDLDLREKVVLTGTVKEHDEYNGEKQTKLTRIKTSPVK
jgi:uncharacterized protein (DUF3820 family)